MKIEIDYSEITTGKVAKQLDLYELTSKGKGNAHKIILAGFDENNQFWGVCVDGAGEGRIGMYDHTQFSKLPSKIKITMTQE